LLQGSRVLEVGCGLALPSLVAAKLGAKVTATDFHPEVPLFLRRNLALNEVPEFEFLKMDWQNEFNHRLGLFDWVIGSDILYEKQHPALVARVVSRYLQPEGKIVVADPSRPYLQPFVDEMKRLGFTYETLIRTVPDEPVPKDVFLLTFQRMPI
jgi:predicted nicotinamide N-methyase